MIEHMKHVTIREAWDTVSDRYDKKINELIRVVNELTIKVSVLESPKNKPKYAKLRKLEQELKQLRLELGE